MPLFLKAERYEMLQKGSGFTQVTVHFLKPPLYSEIHTSGYKSRFSLRAESPARAVHSNDSSNENSGEVNLGARSLGKRSRAIAASVMAARGS